MRFERIQGSAVSDLISYHNDSSEFVTLDVETTSKDPRQAVLIDVQISGEDEDTVYIFGAKDAGKLLGLKRDLPIIAHSYKYDAHVLFRHGIDLLKHTWRDTLLIGHLLDENRESYKLDSYIQEIWNDAYKEAFWAKNESYEEAPEEEKMSYACKDVYYTGKIFHRFRSFINEGEIPDRLVRHVHSLQAYLLLTEINGIAVDKEYLTELGYRTKRRIDELRVEMRSCVKDEIEIIELEAWQKEIGKRLSPKGRANVRRTPFNFDSSTQLQQLLYGSLDLPVQRNAKTRAASTDFDSLERLRDGHPIVAKIQENRELQKIYGTYVEGTLEKVEDGKVFPQFRVAGTVTGRLAHSSPNLAQLPKSGGVRGIYVPNRGRRLISADYSQLEVVIEANLTGDKNLIHMLENGESKHDLTARELRCDRATAKTLNFCLQYWGSHFKVAKLLNCSLNEAERIWKRYWEVYSGPKDLKAKTDRMVDGGVPLQTVYGRKRRFAVKKRSLWDGDYRQAYNFLIQGTGADITSEAFINISEYLSDKVIGRGLFTVHDEIMVEVDENSVDAAEKALIEFMERVGTRLEFRVPLKAQSSGPMLRWED